MTQYSPQPSSTSTPTHMASSRNPGASHAPQPRPIDAALNTSDLKAPEHSIPILGQWRRLCRLGVADPTHHHLPEHATTLTSRSSIGPSAPGIPRSWINTWPSSTETDLQRLPSTVTLLAPLEGNSSIRCLISLDPGGDPGHSGETPYWDASFSVPFWLFVRPRLKAWSNALLLFT
ncbi:hypothetical protein MRS44_001032 [Fusarium solani]|uniref:uncharacterized protein n=1 Tax=Fusarium solani TaxID=169388 RepID=UPI0032C3DCA4|nr:hypothetical protein MRS44_001032 [Fusarium solani]